MATQGANEIFKEFKEQSISQFFKKNRQMLGYSSAARSLVTIVHEYVTNSLDACEEAEILPDIRVAVEKVSDNRFRVKVSDNGPGIPKNFVGKALAELLAGTKFHRNLQQRGQQGIGAAGCTLFAQVTTGKPIHVVSSLGQEKAAYSCDISMDTMRNKALINNVVELKDMPHCLSVEGEFGEVKYDTTDHGILEYLKRTALSNPHVEVTFIDPNGEEHKFLRSTESVPERPQISRLHPLGLSLNDLVEAAHSSKSNKVSTFLVETFARFSTGKVDELRALLKDVDFDKSPKQFTVDDAEKMIDAFKLVKWIAPDASQIIPIGEKQITDALKNILNPEFVRVVERKPKVFKGGFPFIVEAAIAYGGNSGKKTEEGYTASIMRFANRVPLLFDSGTCAITAATRDIQWKRYGMDIDSQPISIFVNVSSVHIPYSGVGKESISQEDEIVEEIKLALMDTGRAIQHFVRGKQQLNMSKGKYRTVMRYTGQLSKDLSELTGENREEIAKMLEKLVAKHFPISKEEEEEEKGGKEADEKADSDSEEE